MITVGSIIHTEEAAEHGLDFQVEGTNIKAYALVNGLQEAHRRVSELLTNPEQLDSEQYDEMVDSLEWSLGAAAVLIRQLAKASAMGVEDVRAECQRLAVNRFGPGAIIETQAIPLDGDGPSILCTDEWTAKAGPGVEVKCECGTASHMKLLDPGVTIEHCGSEHEALLGLHGALQGMA